VAGPVGCIAEGVGVAEAQADRINAKIIRLENSILFFIWILQFRAEGTFIAVRIRWTTIINKRISCV
jgi:hypothetical protein